jgi:murein DD-endopeptidase MepM/ murein hydrolase activator NlpD
MKHKMKKTEVALYALTALLTLNCATSIRAVSPSINLYRSEVEVPRKNLLKNYLNKTDSIFKIKDFEEILNEYSPKGLEDVVLKCPLEEGHFKIGDKYGMRMHPVYHELRMHTGIDLKAKKGEKVYATYGGRIKLMRWAGGYGRKISIEHFNGFVTTYSHLKSYAQNIKEGIEVKQGQEIGEVGHSGTATGDHLHWEIVKNGKYENPENYLDLRSESKEIFAIRNN